MATFAEGSSEASHCVVVGGLQVVGHVGDASVVEGEPLAVEASGEEPYIVGASEAEPAVNGNAKNAKKVGNFDLLTVL